MDAQTRYPLNTSLTILPAGQASQPQTPEQLQSALAAQKTVTNIALGIAAIASVIAIAKHVNCTLQSARLETEYLRRSERMSRGQTGYAPTYGYPSGPGYGY